MGKSSIEVIPGDMMDYMFNSTHHHIDYHILTIGWCQWITIVGLNFAAGMATLATLTKSRTFSRSTSLMLRALLVSDILSSIFFLFYDTYQLTMSLTGTVIRMTTFTCYCWSSMQWFFIGYTTMMTFVLSVDRLIAMTAPTFYEATFSGYRRHFVVLPLIINSVIYFLSFFDTFEPKELEYCTVRASSGKYYRTLFGLICFILNLATSVTYCTMFVIVQSEYRKPPNGPGSSKINNLEEIKAARAKKLAHILAFSCLCYSLTSLVQSILMTVLILWFPKTLATYGLLTGWLSSMDSIIIFCSFFFFMRDFRRSIKRRFFNTGNRVEPTRTLHTVHLNNGVLPH
uniref:G-protein coupled receptors family 1 profile domain-containing protein n=1 Tax=Romanomermis culicivorax TaxID=13658 RepID=A0A915HTD8_ROMCU